MCIVAFNLGRWQESQQLPSSKQKARMFAFTAFICPAIRLPKWGNEGASEDKKGRTASLWNKRRWNESHETPEKGTTSIAWRRQSEIYFCLRLTMIVISKNLQPSMTDENLKEINEKTGISIKFFHHVHGKCEPQIAIAANGGPKQFSKLNFRCLHSQRFFSSAQREHF